MDWKQRNIRMCAAVLVSAVLMRLALSGAFLPVVQALEDPRAASFFVYLQTGRVVRSLPEEVQAPTEPAEAAAESLPSFTAEDAALVPITYSCDQSPDIAGLLATPLDWDLTGDEPSVLILHSHTTESYTQIDGDRYEETSSYRTLDPGHNMLCLGQIVADVLTEAGVGVIHDTSLHDYPSYSDSYSQAAATTKEYLEQYPSIRLILDLHRDAAETASGQMSTSCSVGGQDAAQLMFVVGTDTRLNHPDWEKNLALALKLQVLLEQKNPGICRDLNLSRNRYNQHLGDTALLIEIGAAGNTLSQAKLAAQALGEAIAQLAKGTA